jgi:hypothetical protein
LAEAFPRQHPQSDRAKTAARDERRDVPPATYAVAVHIVMFV